jgi:TetR/AcrR family transcriptional regulator
MVDEKRDTEEIIKAAAKKEFLLNGLKGARMQAIADGAGINKAMLHYYFRTKDKLFEVIFADAMREMNERMGAIVDAETDIFEKIRHFIYEYSEKAAHSDDPEFDLFLMNEFRQNPAYFDQVMKTSSAGKSIRSFINALEKAVKKKQIVGDPHQIFLSMMGACIFPFAGMTMIRTMIGKSEGAYQKLLKERRDFLVQFLTRAITP